MNVGIVAGEISGDHLGSGLIRSLQQLQPAVSISGVGGPQMMAAGCHSLYDMERLAVMGLYQHFSAHKPDVFIGIDAPDFNLGLELKLKKLGIPTVHYVSPSVWAWRKKRIHKIAKATDLVLTLFPFETAFYKQHNVPAEFVGHPLADAIPLEDCKTTAREQLKLNPTDTLIALLPGSRRNEIFYLADIFIETAKQCLQQNPKLIFITASANSARDKEFKEHCQRIAPNLPIHFFVGQSHQVMAAADIVLVTSGTATLEAMLFKRPMIVAYKMANLTYQIAKHLVKIPHIALPNLLANQRLVPEFIQNEVIPANLTNAIFDYLNHPEKIISMQHEFLKIHRQLSRGANESAALAVLKLLR
jgi:lipid-A-disaccharide synthase